MARPKSLATLSLDALLKLRDDVTEMLGTQAAAMQEQLARLTDVGTGGRRGRKPRVSKLKGRKAPVKYRDSKGNTWSGRGAQPRWMTAAIKAGAKRDDFLVGNAAKKSAKKARPARKAKRVKRSAKKAKAANRAKKRVMRSKPRRPAKRRAAGSKAKAVNTAKRVTAPPEATANAGAS